MTQNKNRQVPQIISSGLVVFGITDGVSSPFDESVLWKLHEIANSKSYRKAPELRKKELVKFGITLGQCAVESLKGEWKQKGPRYRDAVVVIGDGIDAFECEPFSDAERFLQNPAANSLIKMFRALELKTKTSAIFTT